MPQGAVQNSIQLEGVPSNLNEALKRKTPPTLSIDFGKTTLHLTAKLSFF